jgi:hypothetical protein
VPVVRRGARGLGERGDAPGPAAGRGQRAGEAAAVAVPGLPGDACPFACPAAAGAGHRKIAGLLGRPESTVRGWLRALARNAGRVRERFTSLAASLVTDPPLPAPAGSPLADAVAAVAAAAAAAVMLAGVGAVARWELASAVTCGLLLAPSWPVMAGNASWLWAAAR